MIFDSGKYILLEYFSRSVLPSTKMEGKMRLFSIFSGVYLLFSLWYSPANGQIGGAQHYGKVVIQMGKWRQARRNIFIIILLYFISSSSLFIIIIIISSANIILFRRKTVVYSYSYSETY